MADKVLFLADKKKQKEEGVTTNSENPAPEAPAEENFAEVMRKNAENKRRQEEERKKANKGVIRSYRLKH